MQTFDCKIVDENGSVFHREIMADTKFEAIDSVTKTGELILSVKKKKSSINLNSLFINLQKPKPEEVEHFTSQLATLLNTGVPLLASLEALKVQAESEAMRLIITEVHQDLSKGSSLSNALRKHPKIFGVMYINMIEAGEKAGVMDPVLHRLSSFIQKEIDMKANIKSGVRYPIIIFANIILAFILAIIFVIPRFANLYSSQGVELPLPTQLLINLNQMVTNYWMTTFVSVIVLAIGLIYFFKTPKGRRIKDWIKLNAPIVKTIYGKNILVRFSHMLATLIQSGIHIISSLEIVEKIVGNSIISELISEAKEDAIQGKSLASSLGRSKYFPPMTVKMISIGEQSGSLEIMLNKIAEQYDNEVNHLLTRLSAMLEPLMTVIMGIFLIILAMGIFLPMWNIYEVF